MYRQEKILFVDDDPELLEACQCVLRKRFCIHTRLGPEAGLIAVERDGPYAVVVSDMQMPGMDGVQFLTQVRAKMPESIRMMLTGFPDLQTAIDAVNQGNVFRFLTKPCTTDQLAAALEAGLEQHRMARARHALLEAQLRHAQKMALVGQCAAGVAHDLNNILAVIQACADLAVKQQPDSSSLAESLQRIQQAADNAAHLTQQLLAFSRREERARRGLVDLSKVLRELTPLLSHLLPKNIAVHCEAPEGLATICGDTHMVGQVVMNLALNARDAMPEGGKLVMRAEARLLTAHHTARSPHARLGRFVCLSVSDTGCGMDTVVRHRVFEPFFTTKAEDKGTGLGLAVVTDIVNLHQGWIEVSSRVGEGTTFEVFFPVAPSLVIPVKTMNNKKRILFVDDEPQVLQGLQRLLHSMRTEWEMAFVESGARALELMVQTPFDVVVSDMRMPGMNGAQLLNEVMKRYPKTVRLILSGHADKELILKCVGSTHQYLSKPCDPDALKAVLLRAAAVNACLDSDRLRQLVSRMDRLPSIPSVYSEIVEKLQNPNASLEEIGAVIVKDIGMTANILKLVNSAFFGLRHPMAEPTEAVAYLGLETIKTLVLSINAFSQFEGVELEGFSLSALWQHSLHTADLARAIAKAEQVESKLRDECFVAGMLHDAGKVVLAANFASQYSEAARLARERNIELLEAEEQVFGANHADVGGYLLGSWALPVPVVEAIALHHSPDRTLNKSFSPLTAVHVANAVVLQRFPHFVSLVGAAVNTNYLAELGLAGRLELWMDLAKGNLDQVA